MKIKASQVRVGDYIRNFGRVTEIMPMHQDRAVTRTTISKKKEAYKPKSRLVAESIEEAYIEEVTEVLIRTVSNHRVFEVDAELNVYRMSQAEARMHRIAA